jgi:hypothetical protein
VLAKYGIYLIPLIVTESSLKESVRTAFQCRHTGGRGYKMAISVRELYEWLDTLSFDSDVAIDDDGLMLICLVDEKPYLEVGGVPEWGK